MKKVCIYHIAEQFLYEYYEQPGEYVLSEKDEVSPLLKKAEDEEKRGGIVAAAQYYEQAEEWNPAGTAVRFHLIDCYFRLNRKEDVLAETKAVYPYCCTRAEMAQYYRWNWQRCSTATAPILRRADRRKAKSASWSRR